jgi:hypothetical protein
MQRNGLLFFLFNKSINLYRDGWFEVALSFSAEIDTEEATVMPNLVQQTKHHLLNNLFIFYIYRGYYLFIYLLLANA